MRKLIFLCSIVALMATGCSITSLFDDGLLGDRKISITGTVVTKYDGNLNNSDGLVTCLVSGTYEMNLWFDDAGGEVIEQDNSIRIAQIDCPGFGSAQTCETTMQDSGHDPMPFYVDASLNLNSAQTADSSVIKDQDELNIRTEIEQSGGPKIDYTITCAGAPVTLSDNGSSYNQMLMPFVETWNLQTEVGRVDTEPSMFSDKELYGGLLADVTFSITDQYLE